MTKKRINYLGCTETGKEQLEGEIVGNRMAAKHNQWRENIKNTKCEKCNQTKPNGIGIYILEIFLSKVINKEYYCYQCSKENNYFEKYQNKHKKFNYSRDIGL